MSASRGDVDVPPSPRAASWLLAQQSGGRHLAETAHDEVMALHVALVLGAAALALWTYVRVADRAPSGWWTIVGHVLLSVALAHTLVPTAITALGGLETPAAGVVAVVAVALPGVTYIFLASLWLLAVLGRLLGQHAR